MANILFTAKLWRNGLSYEPSVLNYGIPDAVGKQTHR